MLHTSEVLERVQIIEKAGHPEWVVVPYDLYQQMITTLHQLRPEFHIDSAPLGYDEALDGTIAFLHGPTDLSERHEDILREEATPYSGLTQKNSDENSHY